MILKFGRLFRNSLLNPFAFFQIFSSRFGSGNGGRFEIRGGRYLPSTPPSPTNRRPGTASSFPTIPADAEGRHWEAYRADILNHSADARRGCALPLHMPGREGRGGCRPPWHGRFAAGQSADQTRVAFVGPEPRALSYFGGPPW